MSTKNVQVRDNQATERLIIMGILSDFAADSNRCQHCGRLLHEHFGGKRTRELLRLWDDDVVIATMVDITCGWCGAVIEGVMDFGKYSGIEYSYLLRTTETSITAASITLANARFIEL